MPGPKKSAAKRKANLIRVLVAEDHTVVRDGLVAIIRQEADMDVVAETGDGQKAAQLWKKHRPDITLMDLRMPGLDGVNAIYQIRAADPSARIIVLTTYDGDEDIYRGMRALQRPRAANKATRAENVAFMRPLLIWIWPSLLCLKSFARFRKISLRQVSRHPLWH